MFQENDFTRFIGIKLPLIQAPMAGGPTTPELIAAVSNMGGLGSLGAAYLSPNDLKIAIREIKKKTQKPFAVNLFTPPVITEVPILMQQDMCERLNQICEPLKIEIKPIEPPYMPNFEEQLDIILQENVPIFSCIFGIPDPVYLRELKKNHCKLIGTATSLSEAEQLVAASFDAVVAQGIEAGGHRGTFRPNPLDDEGLSTFELVKRLSGAITQPIIAAGGIATKEHMQEAHRCGASACQLGTAFLTTTESGANPLHKQALLDLTTDKTVITRGFSGRRARSIANQFTQAISDYQDDLLPFPAQNKLTKLMRKAATDQHNREFMSLWAGRNAHYCQTWCAQELINELTKK